VPGCGFDFEAVYGELGRNYAQVHHLKPLGDRTTPSETKLSDLVIVCANCHAMIHRSGKRRSLENLILIK
jgi:predicted HNH restriction endonuclease